MEGAQLIFLAVVVECRLAAPSGIHHGKGSCGYMGNTHSTLPNGGGKAYSITHRSSSRGQNDAVSGKPMLRKGLKQGRKVVPRLHFFASCSHENVEGDGRRFLKGFPVCFQAIVI